MDKGGGPKGSGIARPAEFLVDSSGTVRWTNFTEDIRIRAKAEEMLAAASALSRVRSIPHDAGDYAPRAAPCNARIKLDLLP
jgi:hypothetical protein